MRKSILYALYILVLLWNSSVIYYRWNTESVAVAEYECQMLMAETTDWDEADIIEACQP